MIKKQKNYICLDCKKDSDNMSAKCIYCGSGFVVLKGISAMMIDQELRLKGW